MFKILCGRMNVEISPNITTIRLLGGDDSLNCFAAILRMYYKDYRLATTEMGLNPRQDALNGTLWYFHVAFSGLDVVPLLRTRHS